MIPTNAFLFAISTAILFAIYGILARFLIVKSDDPLAFAVWINIFAAIFAIPILIVEGGSFTGITVAVVAITILSTILSGIFEAIQFFARKRLEASRSTVIFQLTPAVTFVGSIILLGESITVTKFFGMAFIVAGNIFAAYKHGGALNREGVLLALSAATALGGVYIADKFASTHFPIGFYVILSYALPALYVFAFAMRNSRFQSLKTEIYQATWKLPLLAFTGVLGYYFILKTFRIAEASAILPIVYASSVLTAIGGIILLKERMNIWQKLGGALFVFIGVALLK